MNSKANDNTLFTFTHDNIRVSFIYLWTLNLKRLSKPCLSTAEPITLKDLVKIFARYHSELNQALGMPWIGKMKRLISRKKRAVTQAQIRDKLTELTDEAEVQDKAYRVMEGPNGYQIVTAPQYAGLSDSYAVNLAL